VAISGETVVVGAPQDDGAAGGSQGSAYVFVRSGGVWNLQQKLEASDAAAGDQFGTSVAISGETIVVGVQDAGPGQGSAYVFVRSSRAWSQQKLEASDAAGGDLFGFSVAISGETVVVGAPLDDGAAGGNQGSAYVFVPSGGVWNQQQKLGASDAAAGDEFGFSVAISGETVVVGAPRDDGAAGIQQGSAYVFVPGAPPADTPPTITLKPDISLWQPNHKYRAVMMSQMVESASDDQDGDLIENVGIEKVTSDEPNNAPGAGDGNTSNDIVVAGNCKSVQLRSERDESKNGRVYSITLRVADSADNVTRAVFKVSVPLNQSGAPAVEDMPPALRVTSSCL
jgi:FG-GAP repeat